MLSRGAAMIANLMGCCRGRDESYKGVAWQPLVIYQHILALFIFFLFSSFSSCL
ncbi:hypothetical protein GQ53DRAFT_519823 [Thozetella sp. PMI_491]|nr:hypothetical protein GQ53DRAFT_519823 [Thozetella sp. PMI_491]